MSIVEHSRKPSSDYLEQFDLFMYIEDDMIFRYSTLIAWLAETMKLNKLIDNQVLHDDIHCSYKYPCKYDIGFIRVVGKKTKVPGDEFVDHHFLRGIHLDETPKLNMFCIKDEAYLSIMDHINQAMWIQTREDLKFLNRTCNFLHVPPWTGPKGFVIEYFSGYSLFRNHRFNGRPLNCMVSKIIPVERLQALTIEHYIRRCLFSFVLSIALDLYLYIYNSIALILRRIFKIMNVCIHVCSSKAPRHFNYEMTTLYFVDQLTRKGIDYRSKESIDIPHCWKKRMEQVDNYTYH